MNILYVSSEAVPFARTGGLADVSAALPSALERLGHRVTVVIPGYRSVFHGGLHPQDTGIRFPVSVGEKTVQAKVWKDTIPESDVPIYFIQQDDYFDRNELYTENGSDYNDNSERFIFFCRAVMEMISVMNLKVDILHTNDWQTGLIPALQSLLYQNRTGFERIATIHTIHNLAYQGIFWHWDLPLTGIGWEHFTFNELEFYGKLNLMKAGIVFADGISTVSPQYALEIRSPMFGYGLETTLQYRSPMLRGILNGVCVKRWNPETDPYIAAQYNAETVLEKKPLCKLDLQTVLGLAPRNDVPLFGVVSRFASQKGVDLIAEVIPLWVAKHGVQFCLLGKGDRNLEARLSELAGQYPENIAVRFEFSDELSHKIEAGADLFLMPSRYEPCGLNQMYSQIYGTVPLVSDTGGLADTVTDLTEDTLENGTATGFLTASNDIHGLNTTIWRALDTYWHRKDAWYQLIKNGMRQDWSWAKSAVEYVRFYEKLIRK
ncbi:MAG: glycogen synthase GlgA [Planctomycetaceae bacterium]|jgi:starch synthase|nr:glycogen synthase GlgA [Planctomycetaceae bacterium]